MRVNRLADVSAQILQRRKALKIRQQDLASMTGLSARSISMIENGGDLQMSTFLRICSALKLDVDILQVGQSKADSDEAIW